jgi:cupin fold WbuC family metalloprotein
MQLSSKEGIEMKSIQLIDQALLDEVAAAAASAPRRRKNFNFHVAETAPSNRLLNAMEPDSYIPPHRHLDPSKDETIVVVRGKFGVVEFDDAGQVTGQAVLMPGGTVGINIPHGIYHSLLALDAGSVFFESKAGPYAPLTDGEKVSWAPEEGTDAAAAYLEKLEKLFTV